MRKFKIEVDGEEFIVGVEEIGAEESSLTASAPAVQNTAPARKTAPAAKKKSAAKPKKKSSGGGGSNVIEAPMPGNIFKVLVAEGDEIEVGQTVMVLEAMKMENDVTASSAGTVKEILVKKGDSVEADQVLLKLE